MNLLDYHTPLKNTILRADNAPYIIKKLGELWKDLSLKKFIGKR